MMLINTSQANAFTLGWENPLECHVVSKIQGVFLLFRSKKCQLLKEISELFLPKNDQKR